MNEIILTQARESTSLTGCDGVSTPQQKTDAPLSVDMRQAALAAPSAAIERRELEAAHQQEQKERIAKLGESAAAVLELERRLQIEIDDRKRAQIEARYANRKLEQIYQCISSILGRDIRHLGPASLGSAMSDSSFKLTKLADYIDKARTLDDLISLKRIASNLGVIQPQTMAESAALMGLHIRRAV